MKLTKEQEAKIYCVKHGHANYVYNFLGYTYCGRCGAQIGDLLGCVIDTSNLIIMSCDYKNCKNLIKKLSKLDLKIFKRLDKAYKNGIPNHENILKGINFTKKEINKNG